MSTEFLKSRKFWAMVAGILTTVLIALVPGLEKLEGSLTEILTMLGLYIIGTSIAERDKQPLPPYVPPAPLPPGPLPPMKG